jgi:hypothetical protein
MSLFRRDPDSHLEHELRHARPKPGEELTRGIASRIERQIPARMGLRLRVGVALASTVVLAVFAASIGGVGYAASSATHAVKAVTKVVTLAHTDVAKPSHNENANGPSHANGSGPSHDTGKSGPQGHDNNDNQGPRGNGDEGKGNGDDDGNSGDPGKHEYHKVHMCHGHHPGDDIEVALPAVPAHLAHGDTLGRCRDRK